MDLQSQPAEFSSARGLGHFGLGSSDSARVLRRAPLCALSAGRALRPVSGRLQASEKGRCALRCSLLQSWVANRSGTEERPRCLRGYPAFLGSSTGGDWATVPADRSL